MPGPPRTPTKILRARGSWLAKTREDEPEPEGGLPECPPALTGEARAEWIRAGAILVDMRVMTHADRAALAAYCEAWASFCEAIKAHRAAVKAQGFGKALKFLSAKDRARDAVLKAAAQLGFTPAARSRVSAVDQDKAKAKGKGRFFRTVG